VKTENEVHFSHDSSGNLNFCSGKKLLATVFAQPEIFTAQGKQLLKIKNSYHDLTFFQTGENRKFFFQRQVKREKEFFHLVHKINLKENLSLSLIEQPVSIFLPGLDFVWTPNLCPEPGDVVGDHVFRSPAIILQNRDFTLALIPDLDLLTKNRFSPSAIADRQFSSVKKNPASQLPMFCRLSFSGERQIVSLGLADYTFRGHLYYRLTGKILPFPAGKQIVFGFYLLVGKNIPCGEIRQVLSFLWKKYATRYTRTVLPQRLPFSHYRETSLESICHLGELVEFELRNGKTGAGLRNTSNVTANDFSSSYFQIPLRSIWFHAWHNSLRSGFGICYQALCTGSPCWKRLTQEIKNVILSATEFTDAGFIPAIYDYERKRWWAGVTRLGAGPDILDLSSTCHTGQWLLRWYRYLQPEPQFLARCQKMARGLLSLQEKDGSFPAYINKKGQVLPLLRRSAQAGMVSLFLCQLYEATGDVSLLKPIQAACDFFLTEIIPERRYHDFETFFSCSEKPLDFFDYRTKQHAQNTLSLFWITQTFLSAYRFTGKKEYLIWGLRCLDQLSLYQQVWNPPFLSLYTFGGFGVMNTDGEWNDMRQAFFSEVYFQAYLLTGNKEYFQRAVAALRAGYAQMSHPLHRKTNPLRYDTYPAGLAPENFAHTGIDGRAIRSGFDWGAGALATMTAFTEILYGAIFVDSLTGLAFGLDGFLVSEIFRKGNRLQVEIKEALRAGRKAKLVFRKTNGWQHIFLTFQPEETKKLTFHVPTTEEK